MHRLFSIPPKPQTEITVTVNYWTAKEVADEKPADWSTTFSPCHDKEDFEKTLNDINHRHHLMKVQHRKAEIAVQITLNGELNRHNLDKGFNSINSYAQFLIKKDLINAKQLKCGY